MRKTKIFTVVITYLLLVMLLGCTGSESTSVIRTIVGEQLVTQIDPSCQVRLVRTSPDAKHIAYVATKGKQFMVVDRIDGKQYDFIDTFVFSPDGTHVAYSAREGNKSFIVLDGIEGKPYEPKWLGSPVFSPDSNHLAYLAADEKDIFVVVDGVEKEKLGSSVSDLMFGPDSKRLTYIGSKSGMWAQPVGAWVVVDGRKGEAYRHVWDVTFSPDSKYVAYLAGDGKKEFVVVDRTKWKEYDSFLYGSTYVTSRVPEKRLAFDSPDSFYYLARKGNSIYLVEETLKQDQKE